MYVTLNGDQEHKLLVQTIGFGLEVLELERSQAHFIQPLPINTAHIME